MYVGNYRVRVHMYVGNYRVRAVASIPHTCAMCSSTSARCWSTSIVNKGEMLVNSSTSVCSSTSKCAMLVNDARNYHIHVCAKCDGR